MQRGREAQKFKMDMQHKQAVRKISRDMQQEHADTLLKTFVFHLPSGFGLWNRVSSVVRQI
jgi:hypothetical protein